MGFISKASIEAAFIITLPIFKEVKKDIITKQIARETDFIIVRIIIVGIIIMVLIVLFRVTHSYFLIFPILPNNLLSSWMVSDSNLYSSLCSNLVSQTLYRIR